MMLNKTIKAYRKEMKLTQEQLAEVMGVTIVTQNFKEG